MRVFGLILAHGRSRRFGTEKATASIDGAPMIAHVAARLRPHVEALAVNAPFSSGASAWALGEGLPVLPDQDGLPDGPLSGVLAGLKWAQALGGQAIVTAPCDSPRLPADFAPRLIEGLADGAASYATAADDSHPLCAAWRVALVPALEGVLADGHPSVRALLADWSAVPVRFGDAAAFANVNTPGDASSPQRSAP